MDAHPTPASARSRATGHGRSPAFRDVRGAVHRDLGLRWDVALLALVAASTLGTDDPEVAGWLGEARATFERLKAEAAARACWTGLPRPGRPGASAGRRRRRGRRARRRRRGSERRERG